MSNARDIHVGEPAADFPFEDRAVVHFHDFKSRVRCYDRVLSPNFTCADHEWRLEMYFGGTNIVEVFLKSMSMYRIEVCGSVFVSKKGGVSKKGFFFDLADFTCRGHTHQILVDEGSCFLDDGTLTFEVCIRPHRDYYCRHPTNSEDILSKLFGDKDSADVAFEVKNQVFHAHQTILKIKARDFAEDFCGLGDITKPVPIPDVDSRIFESMLRHAYGQNIYPGMWKEKKKEFLEASGKYGFNALKSEAEDWYLKDLKLTVANAIDELLFADSISSLKLKKAAINFIVENGVDILETESYERLDQSPELRKEVMRASFASNSRKRQRGESDSDSDES